MKRYTVKYEAHDGHVYCKEITGYSKAHALSKIGYKILYWIKATINVKPEVK